MHHQKLQAFSLGALLTLLTFASVATGAGGPLAGSPVGTTPCADNLDPPVPTTACTAADGAVDGVDTTLAGLPTVDPSDLTDGCTAPAPGPTAAAEAQAFVACVQANLASLAPDVCETVTGDAGTPPACIAAFVGAQACDILGQAGTDAAACATAAATQNVTAAQKAVVTAVNGIVGPTPTFAAGAISVQVGNPISLSGTFGRGQLTTLATLASGLAALNSTFKPLADAFAVSGTLTANGSPVGTLAINQAGTFTATFPTATAGTVSFALTLRYSAIPLSVVSLVFPGQATKSATVTPIVNLNVAPVARAGGDQVVTSAFGITLDGSASSDANAGDTLTYAWTQTDGPAVTLANANGAVATFTAPTVGSLTSLVFQLSVSDGTLSGTDSVAVQVQPASGSTHVDIDDTATDLDLLAAGFVGPVAGTASSTELTVRLHDLNGVATLDNTLLAAHLTGPAELNATLAHGTPVDDNPEGDGDTQRDFPYALDFGGRLKGGAYEFAATYDGSLPVTHGFTVDNVAPDLAAPAALVRTYQAGFGAVVSDTVSLALNDANWGSFDGAPVTELQSLDFTGVPSGFVAQVSTDGGATWVDASTGSYDLSAVTNGAGALALQVRLNSPSGLITAGDYVVTATVADQGALASAASPLYTLTIRPQNYGFSLSVDDGGDGIALGSGSPGGRVNSTADPVAVSFTGTFAASNLTVRVSPFTCTCGSSFGAYNADPTKNGKVLVYGAPDLSDTPIQVPVTSTGVAFFPSLGALGGAGTAVYVVLNLYLPASTPAGSYSGVIDVTGMGTA
ncbi:MAG: PKD domain-containing protein [Actinobacteria bacterium]|nr:PKD domain-containing protein [Actinomycetota bacterium]